MSVGGAAQLATLFDEEAAKLPGQSLLLAAGDNVGASPPSSALLQDIPAIDVENAWGLDATSFGNHEFDFGIERILLHQDRANFPFLADEHRRDRDRPRAGLDGDLGGVPRQRRPRRRDRLDGAQTRPSSSSPATPPDSTFLDEAERIRRESAKLRAQGVRVQVVVIHEGATAGANAVDGRPAAPWAGPIVQITEKLQDTTVDLVIAGHTHRAANTVIGRIPVVEGFNAGISYSVAQLLVDDGDVQWAGRRDAARQEPRRRPAPRREGDRRQGQRRHGAACATR